MSKIPYEHNGFVMNHLFKTTNSLAKMASCLRKILCMIKKFEMECLYTGLFPGVANFQCQKIEL